MLSSFDFAASEKTSITEAEQPFQQILESQRKCPRCGGTKLILVQMPSYSTHHAARRLAECKAFRGWESKPANQEKQQQQQTTIGHLLQCQWLMDWERGFLESLQGKRSLSPKYLVVVQRIEVRLGGGR
jgi:hypothetical protein